MNNPDPISFTQTLRMKVRDEAYSWLNQAAIEVNQIWNYCNETSYKAVETSVERPNPRWLSGYDLCALTSGMTKYMKIGADSIQRVCTTYANNRYAAKKSKIGWRTSGGSRRSLGWVPFKAASIRRNGKYFRFCGKTFRVFDSGKLQNITWKQGCFAQDSLGDWYLSLMVEVKQEVNIAPKEAVGIDLGLKTIATTSDGEKLEASHFYRNLEPKLSQAQKRGHKKQAKFIHRKIKHQRKDVLHKFSRKIVNEYQNIIIGNVSSSKLAKTRMAKSVFDAGWGMLKTFVQYKGQQAGRSVSIINESYTSRTCSHCGSLSGPQGVNGLRVRGWRCVDCGAVHDRDENAALNILRLGSRCQTSVSGNELASPLGRAA
jgi:IS605 OrfB family transposase